MSESVGSESSKSDIASGAGMTRVPVITIDGPSGSGKGTVGLQLAETLGWHFLDSGAVYRALAFAALLHFPEALEEELRLEALALQLDLRFVGREIKLENKVITESIRAEICSQTASRIAVFPKVRAAMLHRQRAFCEAPGLIADGRDMGTVVFPEAILKFYLEASVEARALRRYRQYLQLKDREQDVTLEGLQRGMRERDARDKQRAMAPLRPAADAVMIDTTVLDVEGVFEQVMQHVRQRLSMNV